MRDFSEVVEGVDRFVDIGVVLHVVKASPNGKQLLAGKPKLEILRTHRFGGIVDTKLANPALVGPSKNPTVWYCSEDQEPVILHRDSEPIGQLAVGSMGAGKTTSLVMWTYLRWLENLGRRNPIAEGGITAPTEARLEIVLAEFRNLYPSHWYTYRSADKVIEFCDRTRVRLVSTYRQSAAQGSRVQGYNWSFAGRDEGQDQTEEHEHIEARLRSSSNGLPKQLITATSKSSAEWRTLRDRLVAAKNENDQPLWIRRALLGVNSPFVHPSHWARMKASMSKRLYDQLVGAKDQGPELQTYEEWNREYNVIPVPDIGWTDVTEHELRGIAANRALLFGHDPGTLWHVSLPISAFIRNQDRDAYLRGKAQPFWVIRGEINNEQATTDAHLVEVLKYARQRHLNLLTNDGKPNPHGRQILVRADPADTVDKVNAETHKSVYTKFANAGIHIKPAAYNAENDGHGKVPKDPGIEVIKTLMATAAEMERREQPGYKPRHFTDIRLYVERKPDGTPAAPMFVKAVEECERDLYGKAETTKKGPADMSHWTAAGRYALWAIERPRLKQIAKGTT
jgi:hypothetical protein